jgi:hypothetical protein
LVGSTPLSTRFDPEDLREIIGVYNRCFAGTPNRDRAAGVDPFETFMPAPVAGRVTQETVIRLRLLVMLADRLMLVRRAALLPLSD